MNLSEVLDRSRELARSRGLELAIAAVQAVDELAEGFSEPIDEERLIAEANLELSGFGVIQPFLDDPSIEELWINRPGELQYFLSRARSAQSLEIVVAEIAAADEVSELRLCARYREVLFGLDSYLICKNSRAKSYLVP